MPRKLPVAGWKMIRAGTGGPRDIATRMQLSTAPKSRAATRRGVMPRNVRDSGTPTTPPQNPGGHRRRLLSRAAFPPLGGAFGPATRRGYGDRRPAVPHRILMTPSRPKRPQAPEGRKGARRLSRGRCPVSKNTHPRAVCRRREFTPPDIPPRRPRCAWGDGCTATKEMAPPGASLRHRTPRRTKIEIPQEGPRDQLRRPPSKTNNVITYVFACTRRLEQR